MSSAHLLSGKEPSSISSSMITQKVSKQSRFSSFFRSIPSFSGSPYQSSARDHRRELRPGMQFKDVESSERKLLLPRISPYFSASHVSWMSKMYLLGILPREGHLMLFNRKTDGSRYVECLRLLLFYGLGQSLPPLSGHGL